MAEARSEAFDQRWGTYQADDWSDAIVASMKLGGIDNLYFVSGSETAFFQESIAKAQQQGRPAPRLVTVLHEGVALNAALGNSMVTGQPAATSVHVDVGTFNYGGGIHTAWRGCYPVLMTAGNGPRAYPGSMPGARNSAVQWIQEPRDQGEILRQYTKMDHRLEHEDNPGYMISRLLQVAMSEPRGPVYLTLPRESAMIPLHGTTRFPTRDELGIARPAWPDPSDARKVAEWLIKADNPLVITSSSGRNPESVGDLVRLAELLGLPVQEVGRSCDQLNFPSTHPLYRTGPDPQDADVILIIDSAVPYIPPAGNPRPGTKVVWVDADPVMSRYKTLDTQADLWLPVTAAAAARAIHEAATGMLSQSDMTRISDRRARLEEKKREMNARLERQALEAGKRKPLHPGWVAYQMGKILEPDTILLDDSLGNSRNVQNYHHREKPGTYFKSGGSSGGWGSGAAFGAKLGKPDSDVVLATGDGYLMFGSPLSAFWCGSHYKAPFLTVVFVNRSYSTGTSNVSRTYPDGVVVKTGNYEGGVFDPPPDFAKLAEAANCFGETVREPEEVAPALERAMKNVHNGTPALVAMMLPTPMEEEQLAKK
ncbi:MAG: thiamine pyrophosphate-requiring protein [Deltaproteobacteria bacterium]|nr:thiamine pyrophosphate-requiring protein [Deltaproteobacteria bacterium]